ncbi:MAG: hypothetical protein FJW39_03615 [Acidobacteria bacterium]|nr:hypothetical protein [Acidobacteriota bacterium]
MFRILTLCVSGLVLLAGDKNFTPGEASNKVARLEAKLHMDKQSIERAVGAGMDTGIVVVEVKLTPVGGGKLDVNRDDFLLRSDRDGQRSTPYSASQVAGSSVLVVRTTGSGGGITSENRGPIWGGLGGSRPSRVGGDGTMVGSGTAGASSATADIQSGGKQKENPLLAVVEEKILPEKETSGPISGQLYFLMDGKQKIKDIELLYKTSEGRLSVRFKQ